jgi:hypothetical protein
MGKPKVKPVRTRRPEETLTALQHDLEHLIDLCAKYDAGAPRWMKAAAVVLRKIILQQRQGTPLIKPLGLDCVQWYDASTMRLRPGDHVHHQFALVVYQLEPFQAQPAFMVTKGGTPIDFERWWTRGVATALSGRELSRRDIVSAVANRIGAHYDQNVFEDDESLFDGSFAPVTLTRANGSHLSMGGIAEAAIRQIAHETIATINHWRPEAIVDTYFATIDGYGPRAMFNPLRSAPDFKPDLSPPHPTLKRKFLMGVSWWDKVDDTPAPQS